MTRVPGSFEKCIAGIKRLVERGVPLTLKTMALAWNHHEIEAMEAYAKSLGLVFRFDSSLNPRVDCGANRNSELQLDPERALALDLGSPERMEGFREFCERFTRPDGDYGAEHVYTCGAGQSSFTVDPYGRLQMCQLSRKSFHDLKRGRFADGWHELFPMLRARTWQTNEVCRKCSLMAALRQLPGRGRDGDGRHRGRGARLLRARAPAGVGGDGRGLGPPPRRDLLLRDGRPRRAARRRGEGRARGRLRLVRPRRPRSRRRRS